MLKNNIVQRYIAHTILLLFFISLFTVTGIAHTEDNFSNVITNITPANTLKTVNVSHERQLRGAWVATVLNINWPQNRTETVADMKDYIVYIVDEMAAINMNAVFFQVRPEGDAFYKSDLEPWSRFLTGTQGKAPGSGFDPLEYLIQEAGKRGIEVHAWLNPYRAAIKAESTFAASHVSNTISEHVFRYGDLLWMDPGSVRVQNHTYDVVMDIVKRYDIDGIHFDDYFYPYPVKNPDLSDDKMDFPDDKSWNTYKNSGGTLSRDDWRRNNVNILIARVYYGIKNEKPHVRFGISPFGIYRPGIPPGIKGRDQYNELYADPVFWMAEGIIDYIAPQLYWPTTSTEQNYDKLLDWWLSVNPWKKDVFVGHALYKFISDEWPVDEMRRQMNSINSRKDKMATGSIMYNVAPLLTNSRDIAITFRDEYWKGYALPPPIPGAKDSPTLPSAPAVAGNRVILTPETNLKGYALYENNNNQWSFVRFLPSAVNSLTLDDGLYALSAVSRSGLESKGVVFRVPDVIYPDSLTLNKEQLAMNAKGVNSKSLLQPVFTPLYATEREVTWASSDENVASVTAAGQVIAVSEGSAVITAYTVSGELQATCYVTVVEDGIFYGDVNDDGKITVGDAILILRHIVGLEIIPEELLPAADVNRDNTINISDTIDVLRYIVGL